ncbi:MAG: TldD/PmbA family protein [Betaproteobacteria bacterium]|nr:TldD/PmbA family protein [Betaproteobacteria bacterium]
MSRRRFIAGTSGALLLAAGRLSDARGLLTDPLLSSVIDTALGTAKRAGATYADVRMVRRRAEQISTREDHVEGVGASDSYGFGVRVIADGAWGFAASPTVNTNEAARVAALAVAVAKANARALAAPVKLAPAPAVVDVWQTALTKDPFRIPLEEKAAFLIAINAEALKVPGVKFCSSSIQSLGEWKLLTTSEGSSIEQNITRIAPAYTVTAVDAKGGDSVTRTHELPARQAGWEYVEQSSFFADARRMGEDAVEKLKAASVEPGKRTIILAPSNLWLTIHESIGHSTELDRMLGYEANMAGTSFATVEQLGKLRYGASLLTFYADKTTPGGLATCGYDDDGVKTQRWDLISKGVLTHVQTTREQAAWIGETASRGTCYGEDYKAFPFQRMPNVSLASGERDLTVEDLIAATDDGIYITGDGSWSIDHQRYNFQFGGQMFYEVKKGKIARPLRDVAYQANSLEFWGSCDLLGGPRAWELHGALYDGKGEPGQVNAVSHGCPPGRFTANVVNSRKS